MGENAGMHPRTKRQIGTVVVAIVVLAVLRLTLVQPFDSAKWIALGRTTDLHGSAPRRYMYLDLRLFHSLKGKSREQVIQLLGKPGAREGSSSELVYPMGRAPMSLKVLYLGLQFKDDKVTGMRLERSAN